MLSILLSAPFIVALAAFSPRWIERPSRMSGCRVRFARRAADKREHEGKRNGKRETAPATVADVAVRWPPR
ncbi:hypothetical protein [Paraburkholderia sp. LEh10]|uniref:hypothetical protein n=1 Tax=Paraburkholderia sp. LEh10 TaxID=2821353 RepID=UPI001FD838A2|nr:hypothetical protein [Paraburkholderia sp. LEh10]